MTDPGFEEIPLDLSLVPTVAQGLSDAQDRYRSFAIVAKESIGPVPGGMLRVSHLPLMSFINRATSLHAGVISAVRDENPHAAFTLLRAYLELVALIFYVDAHPEYMATLHKPMAELPKNTRKSFRELFEAASSELAGIRSVYAMLSEMAHFGSTALWQPFSVEDDPPKEGALGRLTFSTGPHWRKPDDARIALAMLRESDEAALELLRRYVAHHIKPAP